VRVLFASHSMCSCRNTCIQTHQFVNLTRSETELASVSGMGPGQMFAADLRRMFAPMK